MTKKGISPLVAVIMLIAFTLIVGGILAAWVSQFTQTQRAYTQRCVNARVIIQNGIYDSASKNLTLVIYNYGNVDLAFTTILQYPNRTITSDDVISSPSESIVTYTIPNVEPDLEQISIRSVDCEPPCYKCIGAQDILLNTDIKGM
jgi:flagellin-like protein